MFKKYLFYFCTLIVPILTLSSVTFAAKLHTIIVADVNDVGIGADQDVAAIQKFTNTVRRATCLEGQDTVIEARKGQQKAIEDTLQRLSVGPDDVVFFYYSGHGANPGGGDRWPIMAVEGQSGSGRIKLSWVKDTLLSKNPRFLITMADACNVFVPGITQRSRKEAQQPSGLKKLFLNYKGYIIASSSTPEQYSFGDPQQGGRFTKQFLDSFNQVQALSDANWDMIKEKSTQKIQINHPDQSNQQPQMKVSLTSIGARRDNSNEWSCPAGTGNTPILPSPGGETVVDVPPPQNYPKCADGEMKTVGNQDCCLDRRGKKQCYDK